MRRWLLGLCAGALLAWLAGFAAFAGAVLWLPEQAAATDDCAVLFSGRHGRALAGVRALLVEPPRRLLISGYGMGMGNWELAELRAMDPDYFACCVDVEDVARNTAENGRETAAWAARHGCDALLLVTDDEHMPRALLELWSRSGAIAVRPMAVRHAPARPADEAAVLLLREYHKLLAAGALRLLARVSEGGDW